MSSGAYVAHTGERHGMGQDEDADIDEDDDDGDDDEDNDEDHDHRHRRHQNHGLPPASVENVHVPKRKCCSKHECRRPPTERHVRGMLFKAHTPRAGQHMGGHLQGSSWGDPRKPFCKLGSQREAAGEDSKWLPGCFLKLLPYVPHAFKLCSLFAIDVLVFILHVYMFSCGNIAYLCCFSFLQ